MQGFHIVYPKFNYASILYPSLSFCFLYNLVAFEIMQHCMVKFNISLNSREMTTRLCKLWEPLPNIGPQRSSSVPNYSFVFALLCNRISPKAPLLTNYQ